jgi:hypothetical protein
MSAKAAVPSSPSSGVPELTNAPLSLGSPLAVKQTHVDVAVALQQAPTGTAPAKVDALAAFFPLPGSSSSTAAAASSPAKAKVAAPVSSSGGPFSADDISSFLAAVDSAPSGTPVTTRKKSDVGASDSQLDFFASST